MTPASATDPPTVAPTMASNVGVTLDATSMIGLDELLCWDVSVLTKGSEWCVLR